MSSEGEGKGTTPVVEDLRITHHDQYIEFEFLGEFSPPAAMKVVDAMVATCVESECYRVLLDCRQMSGPLSVIDRFTVAEYGAQVILRRIKIAVVGRDDQVQEDRFFENAAVNRGLRLKVFTDADEAVGWLPGPS
jgi:hypothetical protein